MPHRKFGLAIDNNLKQYITYILPVSIKNDFVNIGLPSNEVTIYDIRGIEVFKARADKSVDLSLLNTGLFFVKISDSNGNNISKKIIKL